MLSGIIVIPCFNEAGRLNARAFQRFACETRHIRLLMVNDGSDDCTGEILDELSESSGGRISILHLEQNAGKAEAVRRGIVIALNAAPDYVGFLDADLATPLDALHQFHDVLERRDDIRVVLGTRIALRGRQLDRNPLRRVLGRLFGVAASLTLGLRIYDTQCGAKVFRNDSRTASLFARPFTSRWIFDVEILARLIAHSNAPAVPHSEQGQATADSIFEMPLDSWREVPGSKVRVRDFWQAAGELLAIGWRYRIRRQPPLDQALPPITRPSARRDDERRRAA